MESRVNFVLFTCKSSEYGYSEKCVLEPNNCNARLTFPQDAVVAFFLWYHFLSVFPLSLWQFLCECLLGRGFMMKSYKEGLPCGPVAEETSRSQCQGPGFDPWSGNYIPYAVLGFPGSSVSKESACNAGDLGSIPGSEWFPAEGNGNPLQYSCLENPMDRRAWRATVHGVTKVGHNLLTKSPPRHRERWNYQILNYSPLNRQTFIRLN